MADATIAADQTGLYEQPLTGGTAYLVAIAQRTPRTERLEVINHGPEPLYARIGGQVTVRDTRARIVGGGQWIDDLELPPGGGTIALISATDTIVSLCRR